MNKKKSKIWMVRSGSGSFLLEEFLIEGIVAIGWNELKKIPLNTTNDKLREKIVEVYNDSNAGQIGQSLGQIWRFYNDLSIGDKVITYDSNTRVYYLGRIMSNYKYSEEFTYHHYRKVEWEDGAISRDHLKVASKNTLGSILTLFEVSEEVWEDLRVNHPGYISKEEWEAVQEIMATQEEQELEQLKEDAISRSLEFIKDIVSNLAWEETEYLAAGLMRAMGYKTRMTKKGGGDLGSDIMASPDGLSMVEPIIKVEVKHRIKSKDKVGAPDLRNFIGGLRTPTKGIYISTTGFSKEAHYEAERANFQVTLIDLDLLVELIVEYYEKLDSETKALVPLRKIYWPI